jgi:hypothetical protein
MPWHWMPRESGTNLLEIIALDDKVGVHGCLVDQGG